MEVIFLLCVLFVFSFIAGFLCTSGIFYRLFLIFGCGCVGYIVGFNGGYLGLSLIESQVSSLILSIIYMLVFCNIFQNNLNSEVK